jgi:hypothetical protein
MSPALRPVQRLPLPWNEAYFGPDIENGLTDRVEFPILLKKHAAVIDGALKTNVATTIQEP